MEETKVEKTLKQSDKVKTVDAVEYKCYLILGSSPEYKSRMIDITESIPEDLIEERYAYDPKCAESDPEAASKYNNISASVIGVAETIQSPDVNNGIEVPLANPFGIFVSIQQKINTALQAAIVNEKQLNALTSMIDYIFKQCEYERELGVKHVIEENLKH